MDSVQIRNADMLKRHNADLNDYKDKVIQLKNAIGQQIIVLGGLLWEIKDNRLWDGHYESFESFLGDPEISFARSTAFRAIKIYQIYVLKFNIKDQVEEIETEKLYRITPIIRDLQEDIPSDMDKVFEWVEKAKTLSRSDLIYAVKVERGQLDANDPAKPHKEQVYDFLKIKYPDFKPGTDQYNLIEEALVLWKEWVS